MEKSLSFSDVLAGMGIFTLELFRVAALRLIFIIYVMLVSLVFFPLAAGSFWTFMIFTIPIIYMIFAIPALLFGFFLAVFMIVFRQQIQRGSIIHMVFALCFAPIAVYFCWFLYKPDAAIHVIAYVLAIKKLGPGECLALLGVLFYGAFIVRAGKVVAGRLKETALKDLLVAPTSVRRQLMAYKSKRAI